MSFEYSCFLPIKSKDSFFVPLKPGYEASENKGPFFKYMMNEKSEYTVNKFIDAMKEKSLEDAKAYLSKNYADSIDLTKLKDIFANINQMCSTFVIKASYENSPKNCKTDTILLIDRELKKTSIFHIYMLSEPDRFGKWKIYGIEQE